MISEVWRGGDKLGRRTPRVILYRESSRIVRAELLIFDGEETNR